MGWSSCCGSPSRTIARAAGAHASTLARLIWPASSTIRTSSTGSGSAISARHQVHATAPTTSQVPERSAWATEALSGSGVAPVNDGLRSVFGFCPIVTSRVISPASSCSRATLSAASSRLPMTLWLLATTPTRCPAIASRTIMWAPV